jgi:hypothetical protein
MELLVIHIRTFQESDGGDKSDGDLVVDVGNEDDGSGNRSGRENGAGGDGHRNNTVENGPSSAGNVSNSERRPTGDRGDRPPSNMSSSSRSTPSLKPKDGSTAGDKPGTPGSKPPTPNGQQQQGGGANGNPAAPMGGPFPPGFPRPPGADLPAGYPYQNGGPMPPGLPGAFPPRPPLVCTQFRLNNNVNILDLYTSSTSSCNHQS